MEKQEPPHILIVSFPIQSHLNPALQFATRLTRFGILVTIATTVSAAKRMIKPNSTAPPAGLSFATFSDGYDDGFIGKVTSHTGDSYIDILKRHGSKTLSELIASAGPNRYTGVVYTIILTWVADVARRHRLPSALLWIQNAAMFSIYYHYFNGYSEIIDACDENDLEWSVKLPSLPLLRGGEIPSFISPLTLHAADRGLLKEQVEELQREERSHAIVLVNSFDSLEHEVLQYLKPRFNILTVGPLLPPSYLESCNTFMIDMFKRSEANYVAWLDSKPNNSVVYVSFGSISDLSTTQMEELAGALLDTRRPFLWVIRGRDEEEKVSIWEEVVGESGMVVTWCAQVEVLTHAAVGCFVTRCGWNSMLESMAAGVPMVAVPIWADQLTNAKMVEEVWGNGVRVVGGVGEGVVVGREEIRQRVEEVMESGNMRKNAERLREGVVRAIAEGGSSQEDVGKFVEVVRGLSGTAAKGEDEEL